MSKSNLVTKESWASFHGNDAGVIFTYIHTTEDIVTKIEELIADTSKPETLKDLLGQFCKERREFVRFAKSHTP
jgi:hypothetical protein